MILNVQKSVIIFQSCSRILITEELDTNGAEFVQFLFRFACDGATMSSQIQFVLLDYTRNGGVTWKELVRLEYDGNNAARCGS